MDDKAGMAAARAERESCARLTKALIRSLERVTAGGHSSRDVFRDWLELVNASLGALPGHVRAARDRKTYEDTAETRQLFTRMKEQYKRREEWDAFAEATGTLLSSPHEGYMDLLGEAYMQIPGAANSRDQFFTPFPVARLMASMTSPEEEINTRLKEAIGKSPVATAALLAGLMHEDPIRMQAHLIHNVIPFAVEHFTPVTICDPACGSGVMFIATASVLPPWQTQLGLVQFYGMDIDPVCARMATVNSRLYGLNGWNAEAVLIAAAMALRDDPEAKDKEVPAKVMATQAATAWCPVPEGNLDPERRGQLQLFVQKHEKPIEVRTAGQDESFKKAA